MESYLSIRSQISTHDMEERSLTNLTFLSATNLNQIFELVEIGFIFTLVYVQVLVNQLKGVASAILNLISYLSEEVNKISTNLAQMTNYHG